MKKTVRALRRKAYAGKILAVVALAFVLLGSSLMTMAEEDQETTYTVRVYAGNKGTFTAAGSLGSVPGVLSDGGKTITYTGLSESDANASITGWAASVTDSKYNIKGIRESGRDNNIYSPNPTWPMVSEYGGTNYARDMDYVIAYGMEGGSVEYTVEYVLASNTSQPVANSVTYQGNVGDTPVIAALYVPGLYPTNAKNLTKKTGLSSDPTENVFTFEYAPIPTPTPVPAPTTTTTTVVTGGTTPATQTGTGTEGTAGTAQTGTGTGQNAAGTAGTTGAGQTGTGAQAAAGTEQAAGTAGATGAGQTGAGAQAAAGTEQAAGTAGTTGTAQTGAAAIPAPEEVPEIADIDEPEVPLAAGDSKDKNEGDSSAESSVSTTAVSLDEETEEGSAAAMEKQKEGLLGNMSKGLLGGLIGGAAAAVVAIVGFGRYLSKTRKDGIESDLDDKEDGYTFEDDDDK